MIERDEAGRIGDVVATLACAGLVLVTLAVPRTADAFCGFYVSQSGESLYNNATRVAMMREGQQTVMSMQNNYAGPAEDFAMVVPVPVVLEKEQVKTLEDRVFERLDQLTSPRLVEYWQRDPCYEPPERPRLYSRSATGGVAKSAEASAADAEKKVEIEAQFDVGEYEVVVLSAEESNALDTWLKSHEYDIPDGAASYFRPYIQKGSYFFVAKVDLDKVRYRDGEAVLSPLRFQYEDRDFKLPVRLGLINSKGSQDLIVYLLAKRQRYRVANYPNVTMPTNLPVSKSVKSNFGGFYDTLFERVLEDRPRAIVTEYSWTATSCDPCPVRPLEPSHLQTLGADVFSEEDRGRRFGRGWTVTRLHARYSRESLGQDLVFEKAPAIRGGRGSPQGGGGVMTHQSARESSRNNFQARYYIRHFWSGDSQCEDPNWGRWGGPPGGEGRQSKAAADMGFQSTGSGVKLGSAIRQERVPGVGEISGGGSNESSSGGEESTPPGEEESGDVDLEDAVEQEEIPGVE